MVPPLIEIKRLKGLDIHYFIKHSTSHRIKERSSVYALHVHGKNLRLSVASITDPYDE